KTHAASVDLIPAPARAAFQTAPVPITWIVGPPGKKQTRPVPEKVIVARGLLKFLFGSIRTAQGEPCARMGVQGLLTFHRTPRCYPKSRQTRHRLYTKNTGEWSAIMKQRIRLQVVGPLAVTLCLCM